jgi:hypothetical protein
VSEWVSLHQPTKRSSTRPRRDAAIKIGMFRKTQILFVTLSDATMEKCGLTKGARVSIEYGTGSMARHVRISMDANGARRLAGVRRSGIMRFDLAGYPLRDTPSARVEWFQAGPGAIALRLPDSAFPKPAAVAPKAVEAKRAVKKPVGVVKADPSDPLLEAPEDEIAEAESMLRAGRVGASALADYFGWPQDKAIRIAAALRDKIEARS